MKRRSQRLLSKYANPLVQGEEPNRLCEVVAQIPEEIWKAIFTQEIDAQTDIEWVSRQVLCSLRLPKGSLSQLESLFRKCGCVCRAWSRFVRDLVQIYFVFDVALSNWVLNQFSSLETLFIRSYPIAVISDESLEKLTNLKSLHIDQNAAITDEALKKLTSLEEFAISEIETFDCQDRPKDSLITDEGISQLKKLASLEIVGNSRISNEAIRNLTNLSNLALVHDTSITEAGLTHLVNLTNLSFFDNYEERTMISNEALSLLTNLTDISITCDDTISDEGLRHLTNLRRASIQGNVFGEPDLITDESITKLTDLRELYLRDCSLLAITANGLLSLPKLKMLDTICGSEFGDEDMKKFTNLTSLTLFRNNNVTNQSITTLTNLIELDIECCDNVSEDINDYLPNLFK